MPKAGRASLEHPHPTEAAGDLTPALLYACLALVGSSTASVRLTAMKKLVEALRPGNGVSSMFLLASGTACLQLVKIMKYFRECAVFF